MDLDHLAGQAGAQVRAGPVHDAKEASDIVGDLGAGAIAVIVHGGEVILQVDAGPHRAIGEEQGLQQGPLRVLGRVIGDEKGAPVEEQALGQGPPSDKGTGIGGVPQLRPRLAEVQAPVPNMAQGLVRRRAGRGGDELAAALLGMAAGRLRQAGVEAGEILSAGRG